MNSDPLNHQSKAIRRVKAVENELVSVSDGHQKFRLIVPAGSFWIENDDQTPDDMDSRRLGPVCFQIPLEFYVRLFF